MLALTDWGMVYLCAALVFLLFFRQWLPSLLIFSSVIHAASVVNVTVTGSVYGLTTYNVTALLVGLAWLQSFKLTFFSINASARLPAALLFLYALVAIIGSWWLPHHFSGTLVLVADDNAGFTGATRTVQWGLLNLVQAGNLFVHVLMLLYLLQSKTFDSFIRQRVLMGWAAGYILVLAVGFYERSSQLFGWTSHFRFWSSNPLYYQIGIVEGGLDKRIGLPFSEPSFASAYLAAVAASCLALTLWGKRAWPGLLGLLLCIGGTVNIMGTTGLVATAILFPSMFLWFSYQAWKMRSARPELLRRWKLAVLLLCSLVFLILTAEPIRQTVYHVANGQLDKLQFEITGKHIRYQLDRRGLEILGETGGLGIGLGSARVNSFVISMLVATGIPGALLWFGSLGVLAWRYIKAPRLSDGQLIAIAGLLGGTLAMSLAVPDLNMPMYWAFIFMAFVFCPESHPPSKPVKTSEVGA